METITDPIPRWQLETDECHAHFNSCIEQDHFDKKDDLHKLDSFTLQLSCRLKKENKPTLSTYNSLCKVNKCLLNTRGQEWLKSFHIGCCAASAFMFIPVFQCSLNFWAIW